MYLGKRWGMTLRGGVQWVRPGPAPTAPPGPLVPTHTDWSEVPSRRLASCRRSVLLGARSRVCFSLVYSTVPPLARSLQAGVQRDPPRSPPQPGPTQTRDIPLEVPGEAQGDVGSAVVQLPLHLGPAWWADTPQCSGAAFDLRCDNVLGAVLADELHGQLGAGRHLSGVQPGHPSPQAVSLTYTHTRQTQCGGCSPGGGQTAWTAPRRSAV